MPTWVASGTDGGDRWPGLGGGRWFVEHVVETGSTNTDLMLAAAAGAPHGLVRVADHQSAGRGRLDRRWDAPAGVNLLVSVLFRAGFDPRRPHELTQRASLAAAQAAEELSGRRPEVKWPNDLLLDGHKLAGILAQAGQVTADGVGFVVVGMGVNLGWAPEEGARLAGVERVDFLRAWLGALDEHWLEPVHDAYRARLSTIGRQVRVEQTRGDVVGLAIDVTDAGALVVETPTGVQTVSVGDAVHLRAVP